MVLSKYGAIYSSFLDNPPTQIAFRHILADAKRPLPWHSVAKQSNELSMSLGVRCLDKLELIFNLT